MENNVVCKAEIKAMVIKALIPYLIVAILVTVLLSLPESETRRVRYPHYNALGKVIDVEYGDPYKETDYYLYTLYIGNKIDNDPIKIRWGNVKTISAMLIALGVLVVVPFLIAIRLRLRSKRSVLVLYDKTIEGTRKKLFTTENFNIPIDRVESVSVKQSVYSLLTGGKTVVVNATSGMTKMPWVRNADEFAQAVRQKIDENKNK